MKRNLCLLLTLLLLGSNFASCAEESKPDESAAPAAPAVSAEAEIAEEIAEEAEISPLDTLEAKDFSGAVYTIFDINTSNGLQVNIPEDEMNGESVNDALITRDIAIEDRYNVSVEYIQETNGTNGVNTLKSSVAAGESIYNLMIAKILDVQKVCASGGYLNNLYALPYMEISQKWYSPLMTDALTLNNTTFFTASDLAPSVYQSACCMFLNLELYEDYNISTDIYQLVLDGKWTLDALSELQKGIDEDINGDNVWKAVDDRFGVALQPTVETATAFLAAADASLCKLSEDGSSLVLAGTNERTFDIVQKLSSFCLNIQYTDINDVINQCFKVNKALFLQHKLESAATHLRDMEADYLVLPTPKADEAQERYLSMVSGYCSSFIGIPITAEPELTGFITEALARYSHTYMRPLAYETAYKNKNARDARTADVLDMLFDNLYIDFGICYDFGSVNSTAASAIFLGAEFSSGLKQAERVFQKTADRHVKDWIVE